MLRKFLLIITAAAAIAVAQPAESNAMAGCYSAQQPYTGPVPIDKANAKFRFAQRTYALTCYYPWFVTAWRENGHWRVNAFDDYDAWQAQRLRARGVVYDGGWVSVWTIW